MKAKADKRHSANPGKITWQPGTVLSPVPAVMVTTVGNEGRPNIITISWAGTVCSEPPMLSILTTRPSRLSIRWFWTAWFWAIVTICLMDCFIS